MPKTKRLLAVPAIAGIAICFIVAIELLSTQNYTDRSYIEYLGNPYLDRYPQGEELYARNIWDLHEYNGVVYIGAGNSSNRGPAMNAGPVPIIVFDPAKEAFVEEGVVDEEQIDLYRTIGDTLFIPGHDPRNGWKLGNYYSRQQKGDWRKYRNIPKALHSYDLVSHRGSLFLALGLKDDPVISMSKDNGLSWENIGAGRSSRVYSFLIVKNTLYATKKIKRKSYNEDRNYDGVLEFDYSGRLEARRDLYDNVLFPGVGFVTKSGKKIVKANVVDEHAIYIGAYIHNDHQYDPFGVFLASSLEKGNVDVKRVPIPRGARPWDILVKGEYVYVLYSQESRKRMFFQGARPAGQRFENTVIRAAKGTLQEWDEVIKFQYSTFARSFEILDGDFYFGMGTEVQNSSDWSVDELSEQSGDILRVAGERLEG
jgi:hypothetical protein